MRMLSLKEVAERLGVCVRMAEIMLAEGRLPRPVRFGRLRRWSEDQMDAFIVAEVARAGGGGRGTSGHGRGRPRSK
ncbi:helix-turn-helix transcriptional regulator [Acidiferrobacter thiooxydans]|uniref:helix-turn-helix transcriptional regulator n=1 Tax=Acidiferrobacter thiooxydans TaxID=163359 RepID=UPI003B97672B